MMQKDIQKLSLTRKQNLSIEKIGRWLRIPIDSTDISTRVFRLTGKAGTGKTTSIKYALAKLLEADYLRIEKIPQFKYVMNSGMFGVPNVMGITMSHKAKNVLGGSLPLCNTYAKYYGLEINYNNDGSIVFVTNNRAKKEAMCALPIKVLVFDECSNINDEMMSVVFNFTNPDTKIILMGDRGQNPPIISSRDNTPLYDKDSPAFELKLHEDSCEELDERVRQTAGNPIIDMSDIIYSEIFGSMSIAKVKKAFRDQRMVDGRGFNTLHYSKVLEDFKNSSENYLDTKIVCYKNNPVNDWNFAMRSHIHNNTQEIFVKGDIIYMNSTYVHQPDGEGNHSSSSKWTCFNSDEYQITDVAYDQYMEIDCFILYLNKEGHSHLSHTNNPFLRVVSPKGLHKFYKIKREKYSLASTYPSKTKEQKEFRSQLFKDYYDFVQSFGNVSYAYAFTGHKIQGSTYRNIYIDVNDILDTKPISAKRKLQALYTGVTRASHKVTLITQQWTD